MEIEAGLRVEETVVDPGRGQACYYVTRGWRWRPWGVWPRMSASCKQYRRDRRAVASSAHLPPARGKSI